MFSSISRNLFQKALKPNRLTCLPLRGIKLHEYQAAQLLNSYGVPVPHVSRVASLTQNKSLLTCFRGMLHSLPRKPRRWQTQSTRRLARDE